jgi:hypothetical protein
MRLTTYSQKQSDERSVFVLWRVGISNFGVLTVEFTHPIEDIELAAELVAFVIWYSIKLSLTAFLIAEKHLNSMYPKVP